MDLNILWFVLLGLLLFGYAVLDGFDLGVGILHLFARSDHERRVFMNSIGPLWDGNEVWLVTFGGALFAAFPMAYASAFSSYYLPFMLLLCALIFRAIAMEFRSKRPGRAWRLSFDVLFTFASALTAFLMGVAVGDSMLGIPIGARGIYQGGLLDLLQPYSIAVGLFVVALFAMHGAIYLHLKTEGEIQVQTLRWTWHAFGVFLVLYILVTIMTLVLRPEVIDNFRKYPVAWGIVVFNVLAIGNIPRALYLDKPFYAFLSSAASILALVALFGMALFPTLVFSSLGSEFDLTIWNAASSQKTLGIMALVALIGMPMVLTYTGVVYWVFRGKVKLGEFSY